MRRHKNATWWQGDREIFPEDIAYIRTFCQRFRGLSRKELTYTLCEHLGWLTPAGRPKFTACAKLLGRLEDAGELRLPALQADVRRAGGDRLYPQYHHQPVAGSRQDHATPRPTLSITLGLAPPHRRLLPLAEQVVQDHCLASGKHPI